MIFARGQLDGTHTRRHDRIATDRAISDDVLCEFIFKIGFELEQRPDRKGIISIPGKPARESTRKGNK